MLERPYAAFLADGKSWTFNQQIHD
jgi:hypothetical protein